MSVTNETYRVQVTLATVVQAIPIPFYFLEQDDLIVFQTVAGADTLMVLNTNYTLAGEGVEAGGTLTTIGGTVGAVWTVARADALTQSEEFLYSGSLAPSSIERGYDRLAMQIQRIYSMAARALRLPVTNAEGGELALNDRKGKLIGFNETSGDVELTVKQSIIDEAAAVSIAGGIAAQAAQVAAELAEVNAETAEANAIIQAGNALTSATTASTQAGIAIVQANNAAASAVIAVNAISSAYLGGVAGASVPLTSPLAGDTYRIISAGTSQGKNWVIGDAAIYEGTSGNWTQLTGFYVADSIINTPAGNISATNMQGAINELDTEKAPISNPAFTGTVTGITASMVGLGSVVNEAQTLAAVVPNTEPASGSILIGNAVGTAYAPTAVSGDITLNSAGVAAIGALKVLGSMIAAETIDLATKVTGLLPGANGGTGVNNSGKTLTLGGNLTTSGAFATTLTATGATSVTLPTTGTLATVDQVVGMKNRLINGAFNINQAGLTTAADAVYHLDQWYALTESGSVTIAQQTDQENGQPTSLRMTQPDVGAKRIGSAQPIESINCRDLRGQTVALRARIRCSSSQAIRWAVVEWTGTADAITKDIVNTWSSGTFTTGNFFISTTTTIAATGSITPAANTWTDLLASATISSSANNLIVFIWSEGTLAQNATLDLGAVQLAQGAQTPFEARPVSVEQSLAARYFCKSYPAVIAPGTVSSNGYISLLCNGTTTQLFGAIPFISEMRATPSISVYSFSGTAGKISSTGGVDQAGTVTMAAETKGIYAGGNSTALTLGSIYVAHFTASARL